MIDTAALHMDEVMCGRFPLCDFFAATYTFVRPVLNK